MKTKNPLRIMFLGTGSDVGKSIMAAGFCRILRRAGYSVAPFKAQNMALNSFVTMDGKEMGRAQVIQAFAAGIPPEADMNPVLLKPSGESNTQVIVQGKVWKTESAAGYYRQKDLLIPHVMESYERLRERFDAIVLEGAGSTAEVNLKENDFVNIEMAKRAHAPAIIVADIDKGGVFGAIIGTMKLLSVREKRLIMGFIINKFRGDPSLFSTGMDYIERRTKRPVFGLLPYFSDIHLPEEDSVALQYGRKGKSGDGDIVTISVIHLPSISNYTDFDPFEIEQGVCLKYVRAPEDIGESDAVIIPGTKNTIADLMWLSESGFESKLRKHVEKGRTLIGICGGYQMLGKHVEDPYGVETAYGKARGLDFLNVYTTLQKEKTLTRVWGLSHLYTLNRINGKKIAVEGYEIHMGATKRGPGAKPSFIVYSMNDTAGAGSTAHEDGATTEDERVWGTYLHGIFENDTFRQHFLTSLGREGGEMVLYRPYLEEQFDKLADLIERHIDVRSIIQIAELYR